MATDEAKGGETPYILGLGNPLLYISADVTSSTLSKYGVRVGNAIMAEEKHAGIAKELIDSFTPQLTAGGATQDTLRVAQWIFGDSSAGRTAFVGCIGDDDYGRQMADAAERDGLTTHYLIDTDAPTGTCAVLINHKKRSLVADLSAANKYKIEHLKGVDMTEVLGAATVVYSSGFFLTVSPDSMVHAAKHCALNNKTYAINLAAPFIPAVFASPLAEVLNYADIVVANADEAAAYAEANGMAGAAAEEVAKQIASLPKANGARGRVVVVTNGGEPLVVCAEGRIRTFEVEKIARTDIVDSNGAGDAFIGGFLAQWALGKDLDECIRCGIFCGRTILMQSGCTFPSKSSGYR